MPRHESAVAGSGWVRTDPFNVVVVYAEDLGCDAYRYDGSPSSSTPHPDQLAAGNIGFTYRYRFGQRCSGGRRLWRRSAKLPVLFGDRCRRFSIDLHQRLEVSRATLRCKQRSCANRERTI